MIAVHGLTKRYSGFEALRGLDFTIARGEVVGFLGPNGAGKTTTMKILTGGLPATAGKAEVNGLDVATDSLAVRARIGYLPESTPLYTDMLVHDYLHHAGSVRGVPRKQLDARIRQVAGMCGLADRLGQVIGTLSKGYRQRVGLAQALVHAPEVLVLDEPTSGLDPNQIVEIRNLIRELGRDRTIILSTHNLPEVTATCSRALIIHRGRIVADHPLGDATARNGERQRVHVALSRAGLDVAAAARALASIDGVVSVHEADTDADAIAWEVEADGGIDLRPAIHRRAVAERWPLVELRRARVDLEALFQSLTQEG